MKVVLQKAARAQVLIGGLPVGQIQEGYVLLLGIIRGDTSLQAQLLAEKIVKLRLFPGEDGKINDRSVLDIEGEILVVSQFTLAGRTEKGNRPDYTHAAAPEEAKILYEYFIKKLKELGVAEVQTGEFGAMMAVELVNDGPVTLILEQ